MECSYSKGVLEIISKVNRIREKIAIQLMKDNNVSGADIEFEKFTIEKTGDNKIGECFRLLDSNGKHVDGYKIFYNYSREGVRVQVIKL